MLFHRISHRIAQQFTAFVFVLLLINGVIFLAADYSQGRRQMGFRLAQTAQTVQEHMRLTPTGVKLELPPFIREQVRIADDRGRVLHSGSLFQDLPFVISRSVQRMNVRGEQYAVMTLPVERGGELLGFIQVGEAERFRLGDLPLRALLYLAVSLAVSALTYGVGLFFARRSLLPAQEMVERLEQFTQDASHELRTPLATLNSSLDLALKTEKHREGLLSAKDDVKSLSVLVERLLDLARLDKHLLQTERVELADLARDAVEKMQTIAQESGVQLTFDKQTDVMVNGDPTLIRQILQNLIGNAIKFRRDEAPVVRVILKKKELRVEDNGIGIAPDVLPRIFDRFTQAEGSRSEEGFGLGLALVKRIADLHGWELAVESEEGKGAVFRVKFD